MRACVRACVRACLRARLRACMRACALLLLGYPLRITGCVGAGRHKTDLVGAEAHKRVLRSASARAPIAAAVSRRRRTPRERATTRDGTTTPRLRWVCVQREGGELECARVDTRRVAAPSPGSRARAAESEARKGAVQGDPARAARGHMIAPHARTPRRSCLPVA